MSKLIFSDADIAPCGMNCGICIARLREKNPCPGCGGGDENKPRHCVSCSIKNCEVLESSASGFCYECTKFPCTRVKQLDNRYKTKYTMSMLENLSCIRDDGMEEFLSNQQARWTCSSCGATLSAHRDYCIRCNAKR